MAYFLCRLKPPRPTFPTDMSEAEAKAMAAHAMYWQAEAQAGSVIVFGPVLDPAGAWGLGIIEAEDDAAVRRFVGGDPVMGAGFGFSCDILPMPSANLGRRLQTLVTP